jgi:hypothetical protein
LKALTFVSRGGSLDIHDGSFLLHNRHAQICAQGSTRIGLEYLALRQQLAILARAQPHRRLRKMDRLLWVWLSMRCRLLERSSECRRLGFNAVGRNFVKAQAAANYREAEVLKSARYLSGRMQVRAPGATADIDPCGLKRSCSIEGTFSGSLQITPRIFQKAEASVLPLAGLGPNSRLYK